MAGQGPAPAENRRRANEPARGDWIDLSQLAEPVLPELPEWPVPDRDWPLDTQAAWEAWRNDPVTSQWSVADISYALDTIRLHASMTSSSAAEVRLRMDALGLTPKGKQDRRWRIIVGGQEAERPAPRRRAGKRRAHLTAV